MCTPGVKSAYLVVAGIEPVELSFPVQSFGGAPRAAREVVTQIAIHAEAHDCMRHLGDVPRRVSEPVLFVPQVVGDSARGSGDHRQSAGHRLENDEAEGLCQRCEHERIGARVEWRQLVPVIQNAEKGDVWRCGTAQRGLRGSSASDDEMQASRGE